MNEDGMHMHFCLMLTFDFSELSDFSIFPSVCSQTYETKNRQICWSVSLSGTLYSYISYDSLEMKRAALILSCLNEVDDFRAVIL